CADDGRRDRALPERREADDVGLETRRTRGVRGREPGGVRSFQRPAAFERSVGPWPAEESAAARVSSTTTTTGVCRYSCWPPTERTRRRISAWPNVTP